MMELEEVGNQARVHQFGFKTRADARGCIGTIQLDGGQSLLQ